MPCGAMSGRAVSAVCGLLWAFWWLLGVFGHGFSLPCLNFGLESGCWWLFIH